MSCWPPCSGWCECAGDDCRPAPLKANALRIRTQDGRYLRAINGPQQYMGYLGPSTQPPGPWDTFLIDSPGTWPVRSADRLVLRAVDNAWAPTADALVRVDHGVLLLPRKSKKDTQLVTYQFGGPGCPVMVSAPLQPGYPAYVPGDSDEYSFTITKFVGGAPAAVGDPVASGDQVTFTFETRNQAEPIRAWHLRDDLGPARIEGDGSATVFVVEFNEVRPGLGWRPPGNEPCRRCARVTAVVTRRADGAPVAGAHVHALPPSEPFVGDTAADGRAGLSAFVAGADRTCVPAGPITLQVEADRYHVGSAVAVVPDQGAADIPVVLDCTMVTGTLKDSAGSPMPGEWIYLTDAAGNPLQDLAGNDYETRTDLGGNFQFACVPHGDVTVSTDYDSSTDQTGHVGPGDRRFDLVVQIDPADLVVRVVDDADGQAITGAAVRATLRDAAMPPNTTVLTGVTAGNPPSVTFTAVHAPGGATIRASAAGYTPASVTVVVPSSGTLTVVIRLTRVAAQMPTSFVLQLDWGLAPRDLDLHASGPDGTAAAGRFHCLFNVMQPVPFVHLDTDDRDDTGPERITITPVAGAFVPGEYHCWVDNFSGEQDFTLSGASLTLLSFDPSSPLPTQRGRWVVANVAPPPDRLWFVVRFGLDAQGQLTLLPEMTYQPGDWTTVL